MSTKKYLASQAESDQKDLIISQLKAEIFETRQNERDYVDLAAQLRNLEHRYNLLQEEKYRGEADFKTRNEHNFRTIANLKTDIDTLKSTISETNLEFQELKAENGAIKDIAETRSIDITKLNNELADVTQDNKILNEDVRNLSTARSVATEEKRKLLTQADHASADVDELVYRNNELEKVIREIDNDKENIEKQNNQVQASIDQLAVELRNRDENLRVSDAHVGEAQRNIQGLENEIQDLERANEKLRNELTFQQRNHQSEVTRNLELNAKINTLDSTERARDIQIDDLKREIDNLKHAHSIQLDKNFQFRKDVDNLNHQIDTVGNQNTDLVEELERFNEEDEKVRSLLNRRNRVSELKLRSDTTLKQSTRLLHESQGVTSPKKAVNRAGTSSVRRSPHK
jgi:chromosome segregation ATPase